MCALSHYLEDEGIMTTGIALVRENAQALQPPRALWVPFPLGRPLGVPGDAAFQHRVIAAALDLLGRSAGPVLEDFPEDPPPISDPSAVACPVSFASGSPLKDAYGSLVQEYHELLPWYELSRRRRGRSTFGVSGLDMLEVLAVLAGALDAQPSLKTLKLALEDAKSFYHEALTAQPGSYQGREVEAALWGETALGQHLQNVVEHFNEIPHLKGFVRIVAPRSVTADTDESDRSTDND